MKLMDDIHDCGELFLELERRIRMVRSARIEVTKRYKINNKFYNNVTAVYSIIITVIAIRFSLIDITDLWTAQNKGNNEADIISFINQFQKSSVIILAMSSFITMLTLYLSNKGYGEKASRFQSNYMELTRLLADIQAYIIKNGFQQFDDKNQQEVTKNQGKEITKNDIDKHFDEYQNFAHRYASLLAQSENHEDIDYWKAVVYEDTEIEGNELKVLKAKEKIDTNIKWDIFKKAMVIISVPLMLFLIYLYPKLPI